MTTDREPKPGSDDVRTLIEQARITAEDFHEEDSALSRQLDELADALESASTRPAGAVALDVLRGSSLAREVEDRMRRSNQMVPENVAWILREAADVLSVSPAGGAVSDKSAGTPR